MAAGVFITGTDTCIGKTWSTITLINFFKLQGLKVAGFKPVAAGCEWHDGQWQNEDAQLMREHNSFWLDYELINPYAFKQAVSPHIAAEGQSVEIDVIKKIYNQLLADHDLIIVEGAGGWYSPISHELSNADLARSLDLPVLLVVGLRLGCLNHAKLSLNAIKASGLNCLGWIAVQLDPDMPEQLANLDYLKQTLQLPLIALLPYMNTADFNYLSQLINSESLQNLM